MANNENVNKVVYGNQTLIDLTQDTATEDDVVQGKTFHDASGTVRTGTNTGGGGGGHTIQDATGTSLTQRSNLQFKGARVSDDSTNDRTVVDATCETIDWEDWIEMSSQQQEAYKIAHPDLLILDAPGADGNISADLMTKLWENPSPTSAFAAQNITLSSSDYDFLLIVYKYNKSGSVYYSTIANKGASAISLEGNYFSNTTSVLVFIRYVVRTSDTEFSVANANYTNVATGGTVSQVQNNDFAIPVAIYGIKKTINLNFSAIASDVSTSADKCMLSDGVTSVGEVVEANNLGASITLTSYNSASNKYTFGSDGYVMIYISASTGVERYGTVIINGNDNANSPLYLTCHANTNIDQTSCLFVRKGMQCYCSFSDSTKVSGVFYPLH